MGHPALRKVVVGHATSTVLNVDVTSAFLRIRNAEEALERKLSRGERRDLLKDNFTQWASGYCDAIEAAIEEGFPND